MKEATFDNDLNQLYRKTLNQIVRIHVKVLIRKIDYFFEWKITQKTTLKH